MQAPLAIFELGINHMGDPARARRMIDTLLREGATHLTIQVVIEPLEYGRNEAAANATRPNCLTLEEVLELVRYACNKGAHMGAVALDPAHVELLVEAGVSFFKVLSSDLTYADLHQAIARSGVPFYLSTGAAELEDVSHALTLIREVAPKAEVRLIHTVLKVPTPAALLQLANIPALAERFGVPVAYGQHSDLPEALLVASALGAETLFIYVAEELSPALPDGPHAIVCSSVKEVLQKIALVQTMLGSRERVLGPEEQAARLSIRRSVVAARMIKKGEKISKDALAYKRPGTGRSVWDAVEIIGSVATRDYQKNEDIL